MNPSSSPLAFYRGKGIGHGIKKIFVQISTLSLSSFMTLNLNNEGNSIYSENFLGHPLVAQWVNNLVLSLLCLWLLLWLGSIPSLGTSTCVGNGQKFFFFKLKFDFTEVKYADNLKSK